MWAQMKMTFLVLATFVYFAFWNSTFTMYICPLLQQPSHLQTIKFMSNASFCIILLIIISHIYWLSPQGLSFLAADYISPLPVIITKISPENHLSIRVGKTQQWYCEYKYMLCLQAHDANFFLSTLRCWMDGCICIIWGKSQLCSTTCDFFAFPTNFAMSTLAPPPHSLWPTMSKC